MNVFDYRDRLIKDYAEYVESFIRIRDSRIADHVKETLDAGFLWPEPLIQLNPSFEPGKWIDELVQAGVLHEECRRVFRKDKRSGDGSPLRTHTHQEYAIRVARGGHNYVLTTGTGSGKSLAYMVPIVDHVLRHGSGRGIQAIVVYPMNALANSQQNELRKFLCDGYPDGKGPITFERYTGQESDEKRQQIIANPPDILLTNYVMLELILTRPYERALINSAQGLRFLVLDELHTYRGRQGADVAMLIRRARNLMAASALQCVGTSATLASTGTFDEQRAEVARVASLLFGAAVKSEHVIGETLRRITSPGDLSDPSFVADLRQRIADAGRKPPSDFRSFIVDPLSIWIENTLGITTEHTTGRMIRAKPKTIIGEGGAAQELSRLTGVPVERCIQAVQEGLLAGYRCEPDIETGFPVFAFRLHQYISRGDTVYASLEEPNQRVVTLDGQQFVPGDRSRVLLPTVFCRECGQEYYCVRASHAKDGVRFFSPRELNDRFSDETVEPGFLYLSDDLWPADDETAKARLPEDWLEERNGGVRIRQDRRECVPELIAVRGDGREDPDGVACAYVPAPFRFCLHCGVSYNFRQAQDFPKLSPLGSEGRSTATTILSLAAIRGLRESKLDKRAQKLLSFTDNRQDASLQAGHFNDFIEIGVLRAALYRAARDAGSQGLEHDNLTQKVFDALGLSLGAYASDPQVRFNAEQDTKRALRDVLGYRLYFDLRRGWRITLPNLEQCGLLEIAYSGLPELAQATDVWEKRHPALATASPETRAAVAKVLLDFMRRELAIKVDYLDADHQERIKQRSSQRLIPSWGFDENEMERLEHAAILYPRSRRAEDYGGHVFLSSRSGFGQYLRRNTTFPDYHTRLTPAETQQVIEDLLGALHGIVTQVSEARSEDDVPGYQLSAGAMVWKTGDGTHAFHDPIRVPNESTLGGQTNKFFVEYYKSIALQAQGIEAREHTAQVHSEIRIKRENDFREGRLPILYCSPTMELGIDIAELNVVNLRNIPPTPANYAQRSGRAGRSGQPALVFTYCAIGSSHDQYFFKRPHLMVSGAVTPPRLDLTNEDLVRAHVHAIWLTETGQALGSTLCDILDVSGENPTLNLQLDVARSIQSIAARDKARARARSVLQPIEPLLRDTDWYSEGWLDEVLTQVALRFDRTCDRWRSLYRAARKQAVLQAQITLDATRSSDERAQAERLRREAVSQLDLLREPGNVVQSDFYPYRYFASEGFLPGYNFPRLPLSAYIPGRRTKQGRDEFLSRPRFLSISEFGPRAIVYHEGSKYLINKVILPVEDEELVTKSAKQCEHCGYLHPVFNSGDDVVNLCERCRQPLGPPFRSLFRLQNVVTKRRDKINSDEEERLRLGYEIRTGVRFTERGGRLSCRNAIVTHEQTELAKLTYGHTATLWRINLGWSRRAKKEQLGFVLDTERGYWSRNEQIEDEQDQDPLSARLQRVIPYVEDRRNCLLFEPVGDLSEAVMASLQAALKNAIQICYQLEDTELAAEPLPEFHNRRLLLFYEAAEGGAGVLRRLVDDDSALRTVAREALRICHFDPDTGNDLRRAPHAREDCEAACYNCLMSYSNQPDHERLDRQAIRDLLLQLASAKIAAAPVEIPRAEHLQRLLNQTGSELEREWLRFLEANNCRLPTKAQAFIAKCKTRPDFLYEGDNQAAIYVDGPVHDFPNRHKRDVDQTECLDNQGYTVLRFSHKDDWAAIVTKYPYIFGKQT